MPHAKVNGQKRLAEVLAPVVCARSPLRISFAGGGTDFPAWYDHHPGAVLATTINRYAYVTLTPRDGQEVQVRPLNFDSLVKYRSDECPTLDGVRDLANASISRVGVAGGFDLEIRSDAPAGSGLGGSSALISAMIGALAEHKRAAYSPYELAELNYTIEREDLEIPGGKQDQYTTAFGGFNCIMFDRDTVAIDEVEVDDDVASELDSRLLLCFTGRCRIHGNLITRQLEMVNSGRRTTIEGMHRLYELVFEMRHALEDGDLDCFGQLMDEAYVNKKLMNPFITEGTNADLLYAQARDLGALGGKLLGAGGGGYLALYCPPEKQQQIRRGLEDHGGVFTDFSLESEGLRVWRCQ